MSAKAHSSIGASSAERWFECPGSVRLAAQCPPKEDTVFSVQGSAAHAGIEDYYSKREKGFAVDILDYVGFEFSKGDIEYELTGEDVESMAEFVSAVEVISKEGKYIMHVEAKFALESIYPGLFGTADVVLMASDCSKLVVIDYKHGAGVPVEVGGNKQLTYYALGAIEYVCKKHKIDYLSVMGWGGVFKEVEIVVIQPRCRHRDGAVRREVVTGDVLDAFAVELAQRAKETANPNSELKTGSHCRWCPALAICPAVAASTFEIAKADFAAQATDKRPLVLPKAESLSPADLAKVMKHEAILQEWLKSVSTHAQHLLEHGQDVPGFKLVRKRANRRWTDEAVAQETLEMMSSDPDALWEKSFVSPAKAEKILGKKGKDLVSGLVTTPEGGVTVAPDHDPREPIAGSAVTDFEQHPNDLNGAA
jgi:hypothetical protein